MLLYIKKFSETRSKLSANQVSLEAKAKLLKNRKSFYTTAIVLFAIFVCYVYFSQCLGCYSSSLEEHNLGICKTYRLKCQYFISRAKFLL